MMKTLEGKENSSELTVFFFIGQHQALDNFAAFSLEWNGILWPTLEHAYQAAKFEDDSIIQRIKKARSPYEAKSIVREKEFASKVSPDWNSRKVATMKALMQCKVGQHSLIKEILLGTQKAQLVEDSPFDSFWGTGPNGDGKNMIGLLWMEIRDELCLE